MGKKSHIHQEHSLATEGRHIKEKTRGKRVASILSTTFFVKAIVISLCLISFTIVFFYSEVRGSSMMARLNANYFAINATGGGNNTENVLVNRFRTPGRGEIFVTRHYWPYGVHNRPENPFDFFIKRLIGVAGDTIYFDQVPLTSEHPNFGVSGLPQTRYVVELNGVPINEYYLDPRWGQNLSFTRTWNILQNPPPASDTAIWTRTSPYWGHHIQPVMYFFPGTTTLMKTRNEIVIPNGYMFFLGDNRGGYGTALESRFRSIDSAHFGPQPTSRIVGTVVDVTYDNTPLPRYIWDLFVWAITFQWARS